MNERAPADPTAGAPGEDRTSKSLGAKVTPLDVLTMLAQRVPVIIGPIDGNGDPVGWNGWQRSRIDPDAASRWTPGQAAAVVCGHLFDVIDVDPRHGGDESMAGLREAGMLPRVFGWDWTPQGGVHYYIAPLGVGSRDGILPGIDLKGGKPDGTSRGFVFIAPTERKGGAYRWGQPVDFDALAEGDESGEALAEYVRALKGDDGWKADPAPLYVGPPPVGREAAYLVVVLSNQSRQVREAPEGARNATLFTAAMKLGSYIAGAGMDASAGTARLEQAARHAGLAAPEITRTIKSGLRVGHAHPRAVPPVDQQGRVVPVSLGGNRSASPAPTARRLRVTWAHTIEPEPVIWGWVDGTDGRLPIGCLAMAAGREGTGKSSFGIWVTAQVTTGRLPGALFGTPRVVLYAAVEDSWKHTLVPRLMAAGADLSLVGRVDVVVDTAEDGTVLVLPEDNAALEATIAHRAAALVVLDPLMSTVDGSLDTHKTRDVRQVLDPLNAMADRAGCLVLGIAHFTKGNGSDVANLITGSGAFRDVPRAILGFAKSKDQRVMTQVKNSLGLDELPSLAYAISAASVSTPKGFTTVGRFDFAGTSAQTVQDLLRDAREDEDPIERRDAETWALGFLADEARDPRWEAKARDLYDAAKNDEWPERTMRRALHKAGAHSKRTGFGGGVRWLHPNHPDHPGHRSGHSGQPEMYGRDGRNDGRNEDERDDDPPSNPPPRVIRTGRSCTMCGGTEGLADYGQRGILCRQHAPGSAA